MAAPKKKFTVVGIVTSMEYQKCKFYVQTLVKSLRKEYDPPVFRPMLNVEWDEYLWKTRRVIGGKIWTLEKKAVVFLNDEFVGDDVAMFNHAISKGRMRVVEDFHCMGILELKDIFNKAIDNKRKFAYMTIAIAGKCVGSLLFLLYADHVPRTIKHFLRRCKSEKRGWADRPLHRLVKGSWLQIGGFDLENRKKPCENYIVPHDRRGVLSTCNNEKHSNNTTQLIVSLAPTPWMDYKFVAFGQLIQGDEVLKSIEAVETHYEAPKDAIAVWKCGEYNLDISPDPVAVMEVKAHLHNVNSRTGIANDVLDSTDVPSNLSMAKYQKGLYCHELDLEGHGSMMDQEQSLNCSCQECDEHEDVDRCEKLNVRDGNSNDSKELVALPKTMEKKQTRYVDHTLSKDVEVIETVMKTPSGHAQLKIKERYVKPIPDGTNEDQNKERTEQLKTDVMPSKTLAMTEKHKVEHTPLGVVEIIETTMQSPSGHALVKMEERFIKTTPNDRAEVHEDHGLDHSYERHIEFRGVPHVDHDVKSKSQNEVFNEIRRIERDVEARATQFMSRGIASFETDLAPLRTMEKKQERHVELTPTGNVERAETVLRTPSGHTQVIIEEQYVKTAKKMSFEAVTDLIPFKTMEKKRKRHVEHTPSGIIETVETVMQSPSGHTRVKMEERFIKKSSDDRARTDENPDLDHSHKDLSEHGHEPRIYPDIPIKTPGGAFDKIKQLENDTEAREKQFLNNRVKSFGNGAIPSKMMIEKERKRHIEHTDWGNVETVETMMESTSGYTQIKMKERFIKIAHDEGHDDVNRIESRAQDNVLIEIRKAKNDTEARANMFLAKGTTNFETNVTSTRTMQKEYNQFIKQTPSGDVETIETRMKSPSGHAQVMVKERFFKTACDVHDNMEINFDDMKKSQKDFVATADRHIKMETHDFYNMSKDCKDLESSAKCDIKIKSREKCFDDVGRVHKSFEARSGHDMKIKSHDKHFDDMRSAHKGFEASTERGMRMKTHDYIFDDVGGTHKKIDTNTKMHNKMFKEMGKTHKEMSRDMNFGTPENTKKTEKRNAKHTYSGNLSSKTHQGSREQTRRSM